MVKANPPLDAKGEKLLKEIQAQFDALLIASTGTALSVAQPRLVAAVEALANHRYAQIGAMEPLAARR